MGKEIPAASFALGISLAANHGTVSIRRHDGFFEAMGRIDGDAAYLKMMQRLSLSTSQHPSPPYHDMEEMWNDQPRQFWRKVRKSVGFPASPDVAVLSSMLKKLVELAEPSSSVIISYPALLGLYQEDIADAAKHLNIRMLPGNLRYPPHEIVAAYAGHGMGLCESFNDEERCTKQGLELPVRETLLVEYTEAALLLHSKVMREADDLAWPDLDISVSFELGSAGSSRDDDLTRIRELVVKLLHKRYDSSPWPPEVITVIMTGSPRSVNSSGIQKVIKDAVEELGFKADMLTSDPDFIAARGAAELAWRALSLAEHAEL